MITDSELRELVKYMYSIVESDAGKEVIDKELTRKYGAQYQNIRDDMKSNHEIGQPRSSRY